MASAAPRPSLGMPSRYRHFTSVAANSGARGPVGQSARPRRARSSACSGDESSRACISAANESSLGFTVAAEAGGGGGRGGAAGSAARAGLGSGGVARSSPRTEAAASGTDATAAAGLGSFRDQKKISATIPRTAARTSSALSGKVMRCRLGTGQVRRSRCLELVHRGLHRRPDRRSARRGSRIVHAHVLPGPSA